MKKYFIDNSTFKIKILIFRTKSDKMFVILHRKLQNITKRTRRRLFLKKNRAILCS